jgi:hypothetical protein
MRLYQERPNFHILIQVKEQNMHYPNIGIRKRQSFALPALEPDPQV